MLSDNLINDSIKKIDRDNSLGMYTLDDYNRRFKTLFLEKFPVSSPTREVLTYLIKIGAKCEHNNESTLNEFYECTYQTTWPLVMHNCFSFSEVFDEVYATVLYKITQAGNGGIADVIAIYKSETPSEGRLNKSIKSTIR